MNAPRIVALLSFELTFMTFIIRFLQMKRRKFEKTITWLHTTAVALTMYTLTLISSICMVLTSAAMYMTYAMGLVWRFEIKSIVFLFL